MIRSRNVITPGKTKAAAIHIREGVIDLLTDYADAPAGSIDYGDLAIMPGVVDSHVHVNEPGRADWEGFMTVTRAAAAGGVTTIVDMPLNSIPPTTTVKALREKTAAMKGKMQVDVGLWGGAVPQNADDLLPLLEAGVLGFKCFLVDSGVPEFPCLTLDELENVAGILQDSGAPILVHAELPQHIAAPQAGTYDAYLQSRPGIAEDAAIEQICRIVERTGAWIHVVHLSSASALETIRRARENALPLTTETTPHYLHFSAEDIKDGETEFKCAPPIRGRDNLEKLWRGLDDALIDAVVSDHSPAPPELKAGGFDRAWGGIASVQFGMAAVWTDAQKRGFDLQDLARWMCEGPARIAGLAGFKGSIAPGWDADFAILDPAATFKVEPAMIHHRHKVTPYRGEQLRGVVKATWVRGKKVFENGAFVEGASGQWVQ